MESTVEQIYANVASVSVSQNLSTEEFVGALQLLSTELGRLLKDLPPSEFAKAWLLHSLAEELLKYSIEDDLVDLTGIRGLAAPQLASLIKRDDWLTDSLQESVNICRTLAIEQPLSARPVVVTTSESGHATHVKGRLSAKGQPKIQVSTKSFDFVPLLEDSVADPRFVNDVVSAFLRNIRELVRTESVTSLCFIEKEVGPVGAISMLSNLVADLGLPASIYRASHWNSRSQVAAYQPKPTDRILLVYDLLVTGDGIAQAAKDLRSRYGVEPVAVVVLFGFGHRRTELRVGDNTIKVSALGWHESYSDEFLNIKEELVTETKHVKSISDSDAWSDETPTLDRRTAPTGVGSDNGGERMSRLQTVTRWKADLNAYRHLELRAITFATDDDLKHAIKLIWSQEELRGLPREPAGSRTIVIPADAVEYFGGLQFETHAVIPASDLSLEAQREIIREQGHH